MSKPLKIAGEKRCVLYQKNGKEHSTAWFYTMERASRALAIIRRRYGRAILYTD